MNNSYQSGDGTTVGEAIDAVGNFLEKIGIAIWNLELTTIAGIVAAFVGILFILAIVGGILSTINDRLESVSYDDQQGSNEDEPPRWKVRPWRYWTEWGALVLGVCILIAIFVST